MRAPVARNQPTALATFKVATAHMICGPPFHVQLNNVDIALYHKHDQGARRGVRRREMRGGTALPRKPRLTSSATPRTAIMHMRAC